MKKGTEFTGEVLRLDYPNRGAVRTEEGEVTVKDVIPGTVIRGVVIKKRSGRPEGRALEELSPAPDALPVDCPSFGACGGCLMLSVPYGRQLQIKNDQIRDLLMKAAGEDFPWEGIVPSPAQRHYRNKMEYTFGDEVMGGPLTLGLHRRGNYYDLCGASACEIAEKDFGVIVAAVQAFFADKSLPFFHRRTHVGVLRHLLLRKSRTTGEILVSLVASTQEEDKLQALLPGFRDLLLSLPLEGTIAGILHTRNDALADVVKDEGTEILYGKDYIEEELLGLRFTLTLFSFFQTNTEGARSLYGKVREYVGSVDGADVMDLYSGTGTITQILAPAASRVTGVEIVPEAVDAARLNAEKNGLANCRFLCGDVLAKLDELAEEKPDIIVLDPPRDGVHPKALQKILAYGAPRLIYIACKPSSLARDLPVMQAAGYRVEKGCCVDMFPGTVHVETVCCLYHQKNDFISVPYEPKDVEYLKK